MIWLLWLFCPPAPVIRPVHSSKLLRVKSSFRQPPHPHLRAFLGLFSKPGRHLSPKSTWLTPLLPLSFCSKMLLCLPYLTLQPAFPTQKEKTKKNLPLVNPPHLQRLWKKVAELKEVYSHGKIENEISWNLLSRPQSGLGTWKENSICKE